MVNAPLQLIAAPFREGNIADPRRLKRLVTSLRRRKEGSSIASPSTTPQAFSSSEDDFKRELMSHPSDEAQPPAHEMTLTEAQLTRTFGQSYVKEG